MHVGIKTSEAALPGSQPGVPGQRPDPELFPAKAVTADTCSITVCTKMLRKSMTLNYFQLNPNTLKHKLYYRTSSLKPGLFKTGNHQRRDDSMVVHHSAQFWYSAVDKQH